MGLLQLKSTWIVASVALVYHSALSFFFFLSNTGVLAWWVLRAAFSLPRLLLRIAPIVDWGLPLLALVSVLAILLASRLAVRRLSTIEVFS